MEGLLKDLERANSYVDDVIVALTGETWEKAVENHDQDLRKVLQRLSENKLVVDPRSSKLFVKKVGFCGHLQGERCLLL